MVFPLVLVIAGVFVFALYRFFATRAPAGRSWRSAIAVGIALGSARAALSGLGFYGVEHTGGPLQVPAFALALVGWPELVLLGRHSGRAQPALYVMMALLLIATTTAGVAIIASAARRRGGPGG
jgi:hypothetical protein